MILLIDELCVYLYKLQFIQYSKMKSNNENLKTIIETIYPGDEKRKIEIIKYNMDIHKRKNNLAELTDDTKIQILKNMGYDDNEITLLMEHNIEIIESNDENMEIDNETEVNE